MTAHESGPEMASTAEQVGADGTLSVPEADSVDARDCVVDVGELSEAAVAAARRRLNRPRWRRTAALSAPTSSAKNW